MKTKNKGKALFVLNPEYGHSTAHIRAWIYKDMLAQNGWSATFVSISPNIQDPDQDKLRKPKAEIIRISRDYDLIYLLKINSYSFVKKLRRHSGAKIIFDFTDALWRPNFRRSWINLEEILQISDAVFSENEYVCDYARQYNKYVFNLPACTQTEKFDEQRKKALTKNNNKVIVGWIGTDSTVPAIYSILKPLERLQARHENLELRVLGEGKEKLDERLKNIRFTALQYYREEDMIREAVLMDIGLFPAPSDVDDYRIRGPLKALIYMSASIPAICLNAGDPANLIKDGINGMLVNSENEWEEKIEKLINDPQLRQNIGRAGYETVKQKHSLENAFHSLEKAFLTVLELERKPQPTSSLTTRLTRLVTKTKMIFGIGRRELIKNLSKLLSKMK